MSNRTDELGSTGNRGHRSSVVSGQEVTTKTPGPTGSTKGLRVGFRGYRGVFPVFRVVPEHRPLEVLHGVQLSVHYCDITRGVVEALGPILVQGHYILNAHTEPVGQVQARLDGEDHARSKLPGIALH